MIERYETLKAEIIRTSDKWQRILDLGWFTVQHSFSEGFEEDDHKIICISEAMWEYREGKMRWYLPSASRLTPEELELTVVHEWVHTLTDPMESHVKDTYSEQCEYVVTCLSKAILATRDFYERSNERSDGTN